MTNRSGLFGAMSMVILATAFAAPAFAGEKDRGQRYRGGGHERGELRIDFDYRAGRAQLCDPPIIRERCVEPEYRVVVDRVWHEPVVRTECETVWVPDRYECHERVYFRCGQRVVVREQVLVEPGHFQMIERQVVVREGYWEEIERFGRIAVAHDHSHRRITVR